MMPAITWTIVAMIVAATLLLRIYWKIHFNRIRSTQELRERFAVSRRSAIQLLDSGQIKPESATFVLLYLVSSMLVRRSHNYRSYARDIILSVGRSDFRSESPLLHRLREEMHSWTPDVKEVWSAFLDNMTFMVETSVWEMRLAIALDNYFGVSSYYRIVVKLVDLFSRAFSRHGMLPIGIDVLRTSRKAREWAAAMN